jgi:hypothetical protein
VQRDSRPAVSEPVGSASDLDALTTVKFDRYKQASIAHQMLQATRQATRREPGEATAETESQAQATEAALATSADELNAARAEYLCDPDGQT